MSSELRRTSRARFRPMSWGRRAMGPPAGDHPHAHLPLRDDRFLAAGARVSRTSKSGQGGQACGTGGIEVRSSSLAQEIRVIQELAVDRAVEEHHFNLLVGFERADSLWMSTAVADGLRRVAKLEDREGYLGCYPGWTGSVPKQDCRRRSIRSSVDCIRPFSGAGWEGESVWKYAGRLLTRLASDRASDRGAAPGKPSTKLRDRLDPLTSGWRDFEGTIWLGGRGIMAQWIGGRLENVESFDRALAGSLWEVQAMTGNRAGDLRVAIPPRRPFS